MSSMACVMPSQLKARDDLRDPGGTTPITFFGWAALELPTYLSGVIHMQKLLCAGTKCGIAFAWYFNSKL
jgi:hypothetical protein